MKARYVASFVLVAALVAVSTAAARTDSPTRASASKITVWLQVDAQSGWPDLVASTNAAFQKAHPGVSVDVQYQTWPDHLGKFDATLAGGNVPDVIEMGNTEMTKYMAAGAFASLSADRSSFANSARCFRCRVPVTHGKTLRPGSAWGLGCRCVRWGWSTGASLVGAE